MREWNLRIYFIVFNNQYERDLFIFLCDLKNSEV